MRLALRPKPKTLTDRAQALGTDAVNFASTLPERFDTSRRRALAVAGSAAGAAAGFAFWRSRSDEGPSIHSDPAKPETPLKADPPPPPAGAAAKKPVTSTKAAAAHASGTRSK